MGRIYDVKEAAQKLGIHEETLRDKLRKKEFSASKIGKLWRISDEDITTYLIKHRNIQERKSA